MSDISDVEHPMRDAFDARDYRAVATLMLERYGTEIRAFLCSRLRSTADGDEAFSMFVEDL